MIQSSETKIFSGQNFISTRPIGKSPELHLLFNQAGAKLLEFPMIEIVSETLNSHSIRLLEHIDKFQWLLLTSANASHFLLEASKQIPSLSTQLNNIKIAVIGSKTEKAVTDAGYTVNFVSPKANSKSLTESFSKLISKHAQIIWPTSNLSTNELPDAFKDIARIQKLVIYRTKAPELVDQSILKSIHDKQYDLLFFFSPSAFENFYHKFNKSIDTQTLKVVSIGPKTTHCMQQYNVKPLIEAESQSEQGIYEATVAYFKNIHKKQ